MNAADTRATGRPIAVAIENDFDIVVAGLAAMLEPFTSLLRVVDATGDYAPPGEVDLILYDAFGFTDSLSDFVAAAPAKVVVFSSITEPAAVVTSIKAGAAGHIYKGVTAKEMVDGLISAHHALVPFVLLDNATLSEPTSTRRWPGMTADLTEREAEMIAMICQGLSNQQIASKLYLSVNSVKTYVRQAYRKIGVDARPRAVLWGLDHGFGTAARR